MKIKHIIGFASGLFLFSTGAAFAVCNGSSQSCDPGTNGAPTGTITTISASAKNANGGTGNENGTVYFFEASTSTIPSDFTDTVNGTVVIDGVIYQGSGNPNDILNAVIEPVVGGTLYHVFVQACPPSTQNPDSTGCSNWVTLGSITTQAYPANPGFSNMAPADTTPQSVLARTSGVQNANDVIGWQMVVNNDDVDLGVGHSSTFIQQPYSGEFNGGAGSFGVTSTSYPALAPNLGYQITENLIYHYNKAGPSFTIDASPNAAFFTQPVNPVALEPILNITHCSATLGFQNAASNPPNPFDSPYLVNIGGAVSSGSQTQTENIGGGLFTSSNSVTYTNLNSGQNYSPWVQAQNRGGAPWKNSSQVNYTPFTTLNWGGNFTVGNIAITSATVTVSGIIGGGSIQSWQVKDLISGMVLASGSGDPTLASPITLPGLTPNTVFNTVMLLNEASGCSSQLATTPARWTTTPEAPTSFALASSSPVQLQSSWLDNLVPLNPNYTTYQVLLCTDMNLTQNCTNTNTNVHTLTQLLGGLTPETTYWGEVRAMSHGNGNPSLYSNEASTYTLNQAPTITYINCSTVSGVTDICNGSGTDNGGPSHLICDWSATGPFGVTFVPNDQVMVGTGTCVPATATYGGNGSYQVTLKVTDHDGSGLSTSNTTTVNVGQTPASIGIVPASYNGVTGVAATFNAIVRDQFHTIIPNASVTWSYSGGNSQITPLFSSFTVLNPTAAGSFTLTAQNVVQSTAPVTITAAGPFFVQFPTITLNSDGKTANLSALGNDNVYGESGLTYNWSYVSGPNPQLDFSANNTNAAKNSVVTFHQSGTYVIQCELLNPIAQSAFANTPSTAVPQNLVSITVTPNNITIQTFSDQIFTATGADQFALPVTLNNVQWTSSGGTISGSGQFSSPSLGTNIRVTATVGRINGSATVTVISYDISGSYAYPVPFKSTQNSVVTFTGLGSSAKIRVYTITGRLVFNTETTSGSYPWTVTNNSGEKVASGVYYYVIESPSGKKDGKLIIIQ